MYIPAEDRVKFPSPIHVGQMKKIPSDVGGTSH